MHGETVKFKFAFVFDCPPPPIFQFGVVGRLCNSLSLHFSDAYCVCVLWHCSLRGFF